MLISSKFRELHRAAWAPFGPWLQGTAGLLAPSGNALSCANPFAAGCDLFARLRKDYPKPEFDLTEPLISGKPVAVRETVVLEKPFCWMLAFESATPRTHHIALIVAPLSGRHATLLRDTVRTVLQDFGIHITDWLDARMVPLSQGAFGLDDHEAYLREFLAFLGPDTHVIWLCQSTVPVLPATVRVADQGELTPKSMTLTSGAIDALRAPTKVNELAASKPLEWSERALIDTVPRNYPGTGRNVYPGFLQHMAFVTMNPARDLASYLNYYSDVSAVDTDVAAAHRHFYDEYNAVVDMAADYYLDTIRVVFQEFRLARGTWAVRGPPMCPQDIRSTALITVECEQDDIRGAGQTHVAHDFCTGLDLSHNQRLTADGCGHYGVCSGNAWRRTIYPQLRDLIYQQASRKLAEQRSECLDEMAA